MLEARDLGRLKTWTQAVAAGLGGLAAAGAIDDSIAEWALVVALALTWISGLDYFRLAPRLLAGAPGGRRGSGGSGRTRRSRAARQAARRCGRARRGIAVGPDRGQSAARSSAVGSGVISISTGERLKAPRRTDDEHRVRRPRLLALLACLLSALAIAPGATSSASKRSWAQPQIRVVVARGLMARSVASFRPNDPSRRASWPTSSPVSPSSRRSRLRTRPPR